MYNRLQINVLDFSYRLSREFQFYWKASLCKRREQHELFSRYLNMDSTMYHSNMIITNTNIIGQTIW